MRYGQQTENDINVREFTDDRKEKEKNRQSVRSSFARISEEGRGSHPRISEETLRNRLNALNFRGSNPSPRGKNTQNFVNDPNGIHEISEESEDDSSEENEIRLHRKSQKDPVSKLFQREAT